MKFKDFQAHVLFLSTFKALNLGEKYSRTSKYFQGCVGTLSFALFCLILYKLLMFLIVCFHHFLILFLSTGIYYTNIYIFEFVFVFFVLLFNCIFVMCCLIGEIKIYNITRAMLLLHWTPPTLRLWSKWV